MSPAPLALPLSRLACQGPKRTRHETPSLHFCPLLQYTLFSLLPKPLPRWLPPAFMPPHGAPPSYVAVGTRRRCPSFPHHLGGPFPSLCLASRCTCFFSHAFGPALPISSAAAPKAETPHWCAACLPSEPLFLLSAGRACSTALAAPSRRCAAPATGGGVCATSDVALFLKVETIQKALFDGGV